MRITLDHNCVLDLAKATAAGALIKPLLTAPEHQCYVVDIGASEMRELGVRPDRYDLLEKVLEDAGIAKLPRLAPMMIWDVTFWDKGLWAGPEMVTQAESIQVILFGKNKPPHLRAGDLDTHLGRKWLNRTCDVHAMWCHLHYKNEVFLTSDKNFMKATKLPLLIDLGAGRICKPGKV